MDLLFNKNFDIIPKEYNSGLLVICHESDNQPNYIEVLSALLKAIRHDVNATDLVFVDNWKNAYIPKDFQSVIVFGADEHFCSQANWPLNQVIHLEHSKILVTYSIQQLQQNPAYKGTLWKVLQEMFLK